MAQENARLAIGLLEADSGPSPPISEATADLLRQVSLSQLRRAEGLIEQVAERDRIIHVRDEGIAWLRNELAIAQREVQHMALSKFWWLGLAHWASREKLLGPTWPLRHPIQ